MQRTLVFALVVAAMTGSALLEVARSSETALVSDSSDFVPNAADQCDADAGCCDLDIPQCCDTNWRLDAGAMILHRSTPDALVLMSDTTDPTRSLNANDFDFDWQAGWQLSLGRETECGRGLQARLMVVDSWTASTSVTTNSTQFHPLQIHTAPPVFAPNVQTIDATYGSDLLGVEVNWQEPLESGLRVLAGFRYIGFDEQMRALLDAAPQTFSYQTDTQNRLFGFQAGAMTPEFCLAGWQLDAGLKAGVFHNSGKQSSFLNTGTAITTANGTSNRPAFVGELGVHATYSLSDSLSFCAGYELLWLETMVLASDQIPATNLFTGTGVNSDGGVFFHGATVGLVYRR